MAYAGKAGRSNRSANGTVGEKLSGRDGRGAGRSTVARAGGRAELVGVAPSRPGAAPASRPRSRMAAPAPDTTLDWQRLAVFAGGVTLGLAFGAGAALLFAPRSGAATRHAIARRGRAMGGRAHDAWDDLRDDLRRETRRRSRRLRRRLADAWSARRDGDADDC